MNALILKGVTLLCSLEDHFCHKNLSASFLHSLGYLFFFVESTKLLLDDLRQKENPWNKRKMRNTSSQELCESFCKEIWWKLLTLWAFNIPCFGSFVSWWKALLLWSCKVLQQIPRLFVDALSSKVLVKFFIVLHESLTVMIQNRNIEIPWYIDKDTSSIFMSIVNQIFWNKRKEIMYLVHELRVLGSVWTG